MLGEKEKQRILEVLKHHHDERSACVEAMSIVQQQHGYISDENLEELAGLLHLSSTELESMATFYSYLFRRPTGRHVILTCESISCWLTGYVRLHEHLQTRLGIEPGQTTPDDRFTWLLEPCLGACEQAPAMMVDGQLYGDLTAEKVEVILERYE